MKIDVSARSKRFSDYILRENYLKIEGWFEQGALTSTTLVASLQEIKQIRGGFAEIGVHHGGFFIALALLRRMGENALAIDVFEDQQHNIDQSGYGDREILIENLNHFVGSCDDIGVLKMDSLLLNPDKLIAELGEKVRIFSVDGCHTKEHTLNDIVLASKVLVPGGVITVDDITNADWPGVKQGVDAFFNTEDGGNFRPFACTDNKLFVTENEFYNFYFQGLKEFQREVYGKFSTQGMYETEVISQPFGKLNWYLDDKSFSNIYGKKRLSTIRFTVAKGFDFSLLKGWSQPETWGTWSDGPEACLKVQLSEPPQDDIVLLIKAHGFVTPIHPSVTVEILVNGTTVGQWVFASSQEIAEKAFRVSKTIVADRDLDISFRISEPHSPNESKESDDSRLLGIGLRDMTVLSAD